MSKELEALENMRADIIDFRDIIENSSYSTDEDYEIVKQALKRNEPMKVEHGIMLSRRDLVFGKDALCEKKIGVVCPMCCQELTITEKENYCPKCGQKLDWSK